MSKFATYELDLANPPPLTPEQEAQLKALADMPDELIDHSDIPPLPGSFWQRARRNRYLRATRRDERD